MSMEVLTAIADTLEERRVANPQLSYVASLLHQGEDAILKKLIEEAAEVLMASKDNNKPHVIHEVADLWFHCMVLLTWHGLRPEEVIQELSQRQGVSGIAEKTARPSK